MVDMRLKSQLKNSYGFTLVELMIVVVIMGILVAVAIPVYGAVTEHSEKTACHANCDIVEKAAIQYMLNSQMENLDNIVTKAESPKRITPEAASALPSDFLKCFAGMTFPQCPTNGDSYSIYYDDEVDGKSISVKCEKHLGKND